MRLLKGHRGVCAGGHPRTVEAGQRAFEAGGNAIDAAVAAQLMATVAEPLLTGLGGGGLALVSRPNETRVLDFFSDLPGRGPQRPFAPLEHVDVQFGVDAQRFSYGISSVATPGMIWGLHALHQSGGKLPLPTLARWAADSADSGLEISSGLSKSIVALMPIISRDPYLVDKLVLRDSEGAFSPAPVGHRYAFPELSETLMRWAEGGPRALLSGAPLDQLLDTLGPFAPLGLEDLQRYQIKWRSPLSLSLPQGDQTLRLLTPRLPSQGGVQIASLLQRIDRRLKREAKRPDPLGGRALSIIAEEMRHLEQDKGSDWPRLLGSLPEQPTWVTQAGFTTHLSACDHEGLSVGITSSLGETAGVSVDGLGLLLNNFLGETDVAPPHCLPQVGERLFTMCSPSLLEYPVHGGTQRVSLGSGGSSRIRSVIVHGALYLSDLLLGIGGEEEQIVRAPRIHYDHQKLRIETLHRPDDAVISAQDLCNQWGEELVIFEDYNLFFGGLHLTSSGALGLRGAGDPRRSGSVSFA